MRSYQPLASWIVAISSHVYMKHYHFNHTDSHPFDHLPRCRWPKSIQYLLVYMRDVMFASPQNDGSQQQCYQTCNIVNIHVTRLLNHPNGSAMYATIVCAQNSTIHHLTMARQYIASCFFIIKSISSSCHVGDRKQQIYIINLFD